MGKIGIRSCLLVLGYIDGAAVCVPAAIEQILFVSNACLQASQFHLDCVYSGHVPCQRRTCDDGPRQQNGPYIPFHTKGRLISVGGVHLHDHCRVCTISCFLMPARGSKPISGSCPYYGSADSYLSIRVQLDLGQVTIHFFSTGKDIFLREGLDDFKHGLYLWLQFI